MSSEQVLEVVSEVEILGKKIKMYGDNNLFHKTLDFLTLIK